VNFGFSPELELPRALGYCRGRVCGPALRYAVSAASGVP
jgi:hypothetical protein